MFVYAIILAEDKMKKEKPENKLTKEYVAKIEAAVDEARLSHIKLFFEKLKLDITFKKLELELREKEKQCRTLGFLAITFGLAFIIANVIIMIRVK